MELREYARYDGVGLRELMAAGQVTAAEIEAVAVKALDAVNAEVNGLALPLFSPWAGRDHRSWRGAEGARDDVG